MAKKKKIEGLNISGMYNLLPVGNGFILKPDTSCNEFNPRFVGYDTFVFNNSADLADFIEANFIPLKEKV